ncbi:MAG: phosphatidylserine decarboxylase [Planctomycetes bacterium]|nr:phosphatidylserine decarboxylase [Planctomycetota bacterium]MCB9886805.1 phosphatidylserine decarboxylase [Planctomycetota bacterium]
MSSLRRLVLTALPKVALSRLCGLVTRVPLPRPVRRSLFRWFAKRYGADLDQIDGPVDQFRSLAAFFRRPLRAGARVVADSPLVWPCDGRIVTCGPLQGDRVPQVKGRDYSLAELLADADLAATLAGGSQATIYLAPGDYHRVHAPFAGRVERVVPLAGTLFPVNPPAVQCIDRLFVRNSRHVFHCRLADGAPAAVVLVGAYNVGDTAITIEHGAIGCGSELGQFGFGSTVVVVLGPGPVGLPEVAPEQRVWMGQAIAAATH